MEGINSSLLCVRDSEQAFNYQFGSGSEKRDSRNLNAVKAFAIFATMAQKRTKVLLHSFLTLY
jgi:hypothetical protein